MLPSEIKERNIKAALYFAGKGFYIFPLVGCGENYKKPAISGWKEKSTTDIDQINEWWLSQDCPFIPAIDCGKSNLLIVDADKNKNGETDLDGVENLEIIFYENGIDETSFLTVKTPSGGLHYYFWNDIAHGNGTGSLPPKIDIRGNGGFIIPFGATLQNGVSYKRLKGTEIHPFPDELKKYLLTAKVDKPLSNQAIINQTANQSNIIPKQSYIDAANEGTLSDLKGAVKGRRNQTLFNVTCLAMRRINSGWMNINFLEQIKTIAFSLGLSPKEVRQTMESATKATGGETAPLPAGNNQINDYSDLPSFTPVISEPTPDFGLYTPSESFKRVLDEWFIPEIANSYPSGLLGEVCEYMEKTAFIKQPNLFIGAALALGGLMVGRGIENFNGGSNNLYICNVSDTGTGKSHPQSVIRRLFNKSNLSAATLKNLDGSYEYLLTSLDAMPSQLLVCDEFGKMFYHAKKSTSSESKVFDTYTALWESPDDFKATGTLKNKGEITIERPSLNILGSGTVEQLFEKITKEEVRDGTLNRYLFFKGDKTAPRRDSQQELAKTKKPKISPHEIDNKEEISTPSVIYAEECNFREIISKINRFCDLTHFVHRTDKDYRVFFAVEITQRSKDLFDYLEDDLDKIRIEGADERFAAPRIVENAIRIATILAMLESSEEELKNRRAVVKHNHAWLGINYALKSTLVLLEEIEKNLSETAVEKDAKTMLSKIQELIKKEGVGYTSKRSLFRSLQKRFKPQYRDQLLQMLEEDGTISTVDVSTGGRPKIHIFLGCTA